MLSWNPLPRYVVIQTCETFLQNPRWATDCIFSDILSWFLQFWKCRPRAVGVGGCSFPVQKCLFEKNMSLPNRKRSNGRNWPQNWLEGDTRFLQSCRPTKVELHRRLLEGQFLPWPNNTKWWIVPTGFSAIWIDYFNIEESWHWQVIAEIHVWMTLVIFTSDFFVRFWGIVKHFVNDSICPRRSPPGTETDS